MFKFCLILSTYVCPGLMTHFGLRLNSSLDERLLFNFLPHMGHSMRDEEHLHCDYMLFDQSGTVQNFDIVPLCTQTEIQTKGHTKMS